MLANGVQDIRGASYSFLQCISWIRLKEPCNREKSITDKFNPTLSLVFEIPLFSHVNII